MFDPITPSQALRKYTYSMTMDKNKNRKISENDDASIISIYFSLPVYSERKYFKRNTYVSLYVGALKCMFQFPHIEYYLYRP